MQMSSQSVTVTPKAASICTLIADDHELFRVGLKLLLEKEGFRVVAECRDGLEAVECAGRVNIDVAILKVLMPRLGGLEAAKAIRRVSPQVRSVLIGQEHEWPFSLEYLSEGVFGYVSKDQSTDFLGRAITEVARGAVYWGAAWPRKGTLSRSDVLSRRERQVLQLLAEGESTRSIGQSLGLSHKTIEGHRGRLMDKLEIHDVAGLVRYAIRHGIIQP